MTTLKISIDIPHVTEGNVPVTAEIFNANMERVQTVVASQETKVEGLSPGFYLVRAVLPSGEMSTTPVQIKKDDVEVEASVKTSASPHEWLARHQLFGGYHRSSPGSTSASGTSKPEGQKQSQKAWLRIWTFDGSSGTRSGLFPFEQPIHWELEDITRWSQYQYLSPDTPDLTVIDLGLPAGEEARYRVVQIGGEELPWRMIVLPPLASPGPDSIQMLLRPSHSGVKLNGGVAIKLVTADLETESLSHSIDAGDYYHSSKMANQVLDSAEGLLAQKKSNPYGALVGGYYLLGRGDFDRLHSWPGHFADSFAWLPDAAIIHAWQILLDDDMEDKSQARERLLEAAQRGLPVFKQGLRYLVDGLKSFSSSAHQKGKRKVQDTQIDDTLEHLQRFTRAANWNQRLVTFYGSAPYKPSYRAVKGILTERAASKRRQYYNFKLPIRMNEAVSKKRIKTKAKKSSQAKQSSVAAKEISVKEEVFVEVQSS